VTQETRRPMWQYDESKYVGKDYSDPAEVAAYDARHRQFRDMEAENTRIIEGLEIGKEHTVLDVGAGTGIFALQVAPLCRQVHAVDVSNAMLTFAQTRAQETGLANIAFHHGGFLTYEHTGEPVDRALSSLALHHLSDFWKQIGLHRLAGIMKPGGRLWLHDVVFSFGPKNYETHIEGLFQGMEAKGGAGLASDFAAHVRDEFTTYDWIMEGLLRRAGFRIDRAEYQNSVFATYLCTRL